MIKNGFVVSLDFELIWGRVKGVYKEQDIYYYAKVHEIVPRLLELFNKYRINVTWATVGLVAVESIEEFNHYAPSKVDLKNYHYQNNYSLFNEIFSKGKQGKWTTACNLIRLINQFDGQELASHTFSHLFPLEKGISKELLDLENISMNNLFRDKYKIEIRTTIFPYNQIPNDVIGNYRSTRKHDWYINNSIKEYEKTNLRALRFLDRYIKLTTNEYFDFNNFKILSKVPDSRFLPPVLLGNSYLHSIVCRKICSQMLLAAQNNMSYHLWWHPHNFVIHTELAFYHLEQVLKYFDILRKEYNFKSYNMANLFDEN